MDKNEICADFALVNLAQIYIQFYSNLQQLLLGMILISFPPNYSLLEPFQSRDEQR